MKKFFYALFIGRVFVVSDLIKGLNSLEMW
jgi:hypothetical protein